MLPQHLPKPIHHLLQLLHPQLPLPTPALAQVLLQLFQTRVDLSMLAYQLGTLVSAEHRHALGQLREYMALFYQVVGFELGA